jgi:hypothetical protein
MDQSSVYRKLFEEVDSHLAGWLQHRPAEHFRMTQFLSTLPAPDSFKPTCSDPDSYRELWEGVADLLAAKEFTVCDLESVHCHLPTPDEVEDKDEKQMLAEERESGISDERARCAGIARGMRHEAFNPAYNNACDEIAKRIEGGE